MQNPVVTFTSAALTSPQPNSCPPSIHPDWKLQAAPTSISVASKQANRRGNG